MTILGITGPTGSGKTTLLKCVEERGGCVLDLDAVYHGLLETGGALPEELETRFPGVVQRGVLDRKALGNIVFASPEALKDLETITGKYIQAETGRLLREAKQAGVSVAAIDAITLLESGLAEKCHRTIAVIAPAKIRVRRIMLRDGISEEYALKRIAAQKPSEFYETRCDYTIVNDAASPEAFHLRCRDLLDTILKGCDSHEQE